VLRSLARHAWLIIPIGLLIFLLPNDWMRVWLPRPGNLPTPTAIPTVASLDVTYSQALQLAATDPLAALPLLADVAFSQNSHAEDAHTLWQAIQSARLAKDPGYTFTVSGRALAAIGEWGPARQALVKAVELDPDYAEAWAYLGEAQQHNGEDGLPALLRAEELDPRSISTRLFLALYWQRKGDYEKASLNFRVAAGQAPNDPMIEIQWGQNSVLAGEGPTALVHFQKALDLAPQDPQVWQALASYSVETELYVAEIGLPSAQRLLLAYPEDAAAMTLIARAHALLEQPETARVFFKRAIKANPQYAPAHLYYAIFLLANQEMADARRQFNEVLAIAPDGQEADLAAYWLAQMSD
jgi:tetratricopeptide (TPR) repeat protein